MTDRDTCKHPLRYKLADDVRDYCPDCGQFLTHEDELLALIDKTCEEVFEGVVMRPGYFCAVDPATGKDWVVMSKVHPDGTIEILKRNES